MSLLDWLGHAWFDAQPREVQQRMRPMPEPGTVSDEASPVQRQSMPRSQTPVCDACGVAGHGAKDCVNDDLIAGTGSAPTSPAAPPVLAGVGGATSRPVPQGDHIHPSKRTTVREAHESERMPTGALDRSPARDRS